MNDDVIFVVEDRWEAYIKTNPKYIGSYESWLNDFIWNKGYTLWSCADITDILDRYSAL